MELRCVVLECLWTVHTMQQQEPADAHTEAPKGNYNAFDITEDSHEREAGDNFQQNFSKNDF